MDSETKPNTGLVNFLAWLEVNKKKLVIGAAAATGLAIITTVIVVQQNQKEARASKALSDIRLPLFGNQAQPPGVAEELLKVAREHPRTKAGSRALVEAAGALFVENRYAEAQTQFEEFAKLYPASPWRAQAALGVAASLDAQSKKAEALARYEDLRKKFANDPIIDGVKLALARHYETSKPDEAFNLYQELVKANPYSGLGAEAGLRQEELLQKHPELMKTNPPAMPPLPPGAPATLTNLARPNPSNRVVTTITNLSRTPNTNITIRAATNPPAANTPLMIKPSASVPTPGAANPAPPVPPAAKP